MHRYYLNTHAHAHTCFPQSASRTLVQIIKCNSLPGGETLLGADHPSGVNHGSSTEMVSLPAQDGSEVTHPPVSGPHAVSQQTHLSLRLTVHGELPGMPLTMRSRVGWKRSSLFPHSLNSTFSADTQRRQNYCDSSSATANASDFISSETNLLVHSWAPSLQLW